MLLVDLVKLFSTNFNIDEERFLDIIDSNNIKLSQRLLVKINDDKKKIINETSINTPSKNETSNNETLINTPSNNETSNNETLINETSNNETLINETSNNETSNKKTTSTGRGRGRPRKTKKLLEENDVVIEVELVTIDNEEYYLTRENVLMTKELKVSGVYVGGRVYACPM
jgi:hypothetical protein